LGGEPPILILNGSFEQDFKGWRREDWFADNGLR